MARVSFTLKKITVPSGSRLQPEPPSEGDNDSALRGDAFGGTVPVPPEPPVVSVSQFGESTFTALPIDYGVAQLQWDLGETLATTVGVDIVPTEILIQYSTLGEPMTPAEGTTVTTILPGNEAYTILHDVQPQGGWVYYSLFAKYESASDRPWYERVASISVLMPTNYQSTELLWARIPEHYRIQDSMLGAGNLDVRSDDGRGVPDELIEDGPLYRALSAFGWELDRVRTLTTYLMRQKDPDLATPEVLNALSKELGIGITTSDLGSNRLRTIIGDIRYLREYKGTYVGTREWLTAITGCPVFIRPVQSNLLTTQQSKFAGTITTTTDPANVPSGNEWVVEGTGISASVTANGLRISHSASAGGLVVARTRVTNLEQALWHRSYVDVTNRSDAQVIGVSLSTSPLALSSVSLDSEGIIEQPYPTNFIFAPTNGSTDYYQMPANHGIPGNGTLTTVPMYYNVLMKFNSSGSQLTLNNVVLHKECMDPYQIDIYSQRVNLVRDPQFTRTIRYATSTSASTPVLGAYSWQGNTTTSLWSGVASGSVVFYGGNGSGLGASTGTGSSVMFVSTGASTSNTPVLVGLPYYASIDDPYDKVVAVSLVSQTYGLITTSSEVVSDRELGNFDGGKRKYWRLQRDYEAPWLPRNLQDCYLVFHAVLGSGDECLIERPLFEAYTFAGEYFDGDSIRGGWLQTNILTDTVRDHRWGDAGQHVSFSYYTPDYQRGRNVVNRLLPSIIPVTQDVSLSDDNFNRVFGYTGTGMP